MRTAWVAGIVLVVMTSGMTDTAMAAEQALAWMQTPKWLGQKHVGAGEWGELEALVDKLAVSGERAEDGRFQLYLLTAGVDEWLGLWDEDHDEVFREKFEEYQQQYPNSAFAPILAAMQVHSAAWRARGRGFSSTVTPEGWALFRERNKKAWKMMQASKDRASRLPTWYEQAISIGTDANEPETELMALFEEGVKRFPGYHPLYFTIARQFAPRWGGSYADADTFINQQVAAKTNPEGETLYARLYWLIDQYERGDPDFFDESLVEWPRMRTGFEMLMKQFPNSAWNQANLVSFACRAGDSASYLKWRKTVDAGQFQEAAPQGISLEVCDARFIKRT